MSVYCERNNVILMCYKKKRNEKKNLYFEKKRENRYNILNI